MTTRTFIIGGTRADALQFCRDARLAPSARSTVILTTPESVRGHTIKPTDVTIWNGYVSDELMTDVAIAIDAGLRAEVDA